MADGIITLVCGASRTGKTLWTMRQIKRARRILAWDVEAQYCELPGWRRVSDAELFAIATGYSGEGKFAYVPGGNLQKQFDAFCRAALYWGRYFGPCAVVAEEISDVTNPSKAPDGWGMLVRRGAKRGISIYGITQRPAESDKTLVGNAGRVVCFRMSRAKDRSYMADELDLSDDQRARFFALPNLHYVHRDNGKGCVEFGQIKV